MVLTLVVGALSQPCEGTGVDFKSKAQEFLLRWSFLGARLMHNLTLNASSYFGKCNAVRVADSYTPSQSRLPSRLADSKEEIYQCQKMSRLSLSPSQWVVWWKNNHDILTVSSTLLILAAWVCVINERSKWRHLLIVFSVALWLERPRGSGRSWVRILLETSDVCCPRLVIFRKSRLTYFYQA